MPKISDLLLEWNILWMSSGFVCEYYVKDEELPHFACYNGNFYVFMGELRGTVIEWQIKLHEYQLRLQSYNKRFSYVIILGLQIALVDGMSCDRPEFNTLPRIL